MGLPAKFRITSEARPKKWGEGKSKDLIEFDATIPDENDPTKGVKCRISVLFVTAFPAGWALNTVVELKDGLTIKEKDQYEGQRQFTVSLPRKGGGGGGYGGDPREPRVHIGEKEAVLLVNDLHYAFYREAKEWAEKEGLTNLEIYREAGLDARTLFLGGNFKVEMNKRGGK